MDLTNASVISRRFSQATWTEKCTARTWIILTKFKKTLFLHKIFENPLLLLRTFLIKSPNFRANFQLPKLTFFAEKSIEEDPPKKTITFPRVG